ncbi:MAG TPA: acetate--CoA ligase family protein, partial [Nocardioides sp.]|uniref:acetate--CoA ligase family protein n=1 Tax=Nocardioides sp. TaxID=35761 RepID=UPI002D0CE1F6
LLARFGLAVVPTRGAASADAAATVAAELGYPVVLKTDEPGIEHRARVGGVRLGITDEPALRAAYDALAARCGPRVVVQPQLTGPEVSLGVVRDAAVGPVLVLAVGGSRIEELSRRVLALPPLAPGPAERLVARFSRLLPGVDLTGLPEAVAGLSRLAVALGGQLAALDVNPMVLTGDGPVAVDALVQPVSG